MLSKLKIFLYSLIGIYFILNLLYIKSLKDDLKTSELNNARLVEVQNENIKTIQELKEQYITIKQINKNFDKTVKSQQERIDNLNNKLSDLTRLEKLSSLKPKLIENVINLGTDNTIKCFEGISNNDLTSCK